MSRRNAIRLISFTAALLVVILGMAIKGGKNKDYYELQLENEYSRSIEELTSGVNSISLLLKKSEYSADAETRAKLAVEIMAQAQISKNALSRLPIDAVEFEGLNKFLSQVGNYSYFVSKSFSENGKLEKNQEENMHLLTAAADEISKIINDSSAKYNNIEYWSKQINDAIPNENLTGSFSSIEEELSDYPTLIYDGPYSDHILEKAPQMIINAYEVTKEKAKETAVKMGETLPEELKDMGTASGYIDTFIFGNDWVNISISRYGGYPVYMRKTRSVTNTHIDYNQALKKAKRYLGLIGVSDMTETYYYIDEGICVINFAFVDGQTICYTDLIKVGVAMDTGEIMLYESSGYLSNHTQRAFETPKYTIDEAKAVLNGNLIVKQTAVALIPTDSSQVRCYEFLCETSNSEELLVYINVATLNEEDILLLLKDDGGTLIK